MRFLRRVFPAVLGLVLLSFLFAACSDDESGPPATTPSPQTTAQGTFVLPTPEPGAQLTTEEIVRKLRPSVVQVLTESATRDIFGQLVPQQGIGTGVIIDAQGHIVTNNHVVRLGDAFGDLATRITVTVAGGRTASAQVVGTDPQTDLAIIKIDLSGLTPAELGDAASLPVGADVVAMGYALGLEGDPSVTRGVVSAKGRTIQEDPFSINDAIQTDASINPGNSGGPLVDDHGRVVGINTAIRLGAENVGLAISVDLVKPIIQELIQNGRVARSFLGVGTSDITPSLARSYDLPVDHGVGVTDVVQRSPAEKAGLQANDIIVALEDTEIGNSGDLLEALRRYRAGDRVTVRYYRDGEQREAEATLAERPPD
jgi:serine protease Do